MIFDSLKNKDNYKWNHYLYKALCFLDKLQPGVPLAPNTVLIPDILFCNPVSLSTRPESECIYEAHRKYIDIHYIVSGIECIATADPTSLTETIPYSPEKDIAFYCGTENGRYNLYPGQFMVCYPSDAHKVAIALNSPAQVDKIVFKIKMEDYQNEII